MTSVAPQQQATPAHNLSASARTEAAGLPTTPSTVIPRGPVTATLNFYVPPADGSVPYNMVEPQTSKNFGDSAVDVTIHDIRGDESSYTLDNDAFAIIQNVPESAEADCLDDAHIAQHYYPEVEQLVLDNIPGATRVVIFDHTVRRAAADAKRRAVHITHIDQTATSARDRVKLHLGDEAEELLKGRYRIVNVWRPLNGPVVESPLAFASSHTVRDEDLVQVELRYPSRTGYIASVKHNPEQRWNYLSGTRSDERILLECFDSDASKEGSGVKGGRVPHSAFVDPRTPEGAIGRESIEVRTLVFGP